MGDELVKARASLSSLVTMTTATSRRRSPCAAATFTDAEFGSARIHTLGFEHPRAHRPRDVLDERLGGSRILARGSDAGREDRHVVQISRQRADQLGAGDGNDLRRLS